jgi:cell division protein FtsQ
VTTQGSNKNRPLQWEDDAIEEPRFRHVRQGAPPQGRALPGMPLEMVDPDDESYPVGGSRFREDGRDGPRKPWWRPAGKVGRVFLGLGALAVLGGLATSAFLLKTTIERDARFRIAGAGNIQAAGLTEVSRAEMLPVFGEDIGRNVFFVPLSERRKQLEEIPWVERATVMRLLPDQIRVQVVERQPVAFTRQGHEIGLVDGSGVLLAMPPAMMAQHHYSFPVVTGIDPRDPLASRKARMAVYGRLLAELDAGNQHLSEQISEIDLTDPEDARVYMPEAGADILAHFGEDHFLERYQRYKAHIAEWRQQYPKLSAVDLRYDQQVVLEMAPGTNAVAAAVGDPHASNTGDAKPSDEQPAASAQSKPKPGASGEIAQANLDTGKSGQIKTAQTKTSAPAKIVKAGVKTGVKPTGSSTSKGLSSTAKALTARDKAAKAAREKKKREEAKRASLNASKRKPAPTHPAANGATAAAEGQ